MPGGPIGIDVLVGAAERYPRSNHAVMPRLLKVRLIFLSQFVEGVKAVRVHVTDPIWI
jgi:hypothetical protein